MWYRILENMYVKQTCDEWRNMSLDSINGVPFPAFYSIELDKFSCNAS